MKRFFLTFALIALTLSALSNAHEAEAAAVYQNLCTLGVFPYNSEAPSLTGDAAVPHINYLSSEECNQHLSYPSAYSLSPPLAGENSVKSGSEQMKLPIAEHEHAYYNESGPDSTYYYKSFTDKFEITLQPDSASNIYTDSLSCNMYLPPPFTQETARDILDDCSGYVPGLYGGTTVTQSINANNTITITWDFAVDTASTPEASYKGRPSRWGENGADFPLFNASGAPAGTVDLTQSQNRKFEAHVNLPTKDNGAIWSATTTSRALIANLAILQTNYPLHNNDGCASGGWCYIAPPAGVITEQVLSGTETRTFYWATIGSVGTVWKAPPPPPPPAAVCASISLSPMQFSASDSSRTFTIASAANTDGTEYQGLFNWSLVNGGTGQLAVQNTTRSAVFVNPNPPLPSNAYITIRSEDDNCSANIPAIPVIIPPPPPPPQQYCMGLNISRDTFLADIPEQAQAFNATVSPASFTPRWRHIKNNATVETRYGTYVTFGNLTAGSTIIVDALPEQTAGACTRQLTPELIPRRVPTPEGELTKRAFEIISRGNVIRLGETAQFELTFDPEAPASIVTIKDTMRTSLTGTRGGVITLIDMPDGNSFSITERRSGNPAVPRCNANSSSLCYSGDPLSAAGLQLRNVEDQAVVITYRGKLTSSKINARFCKTLPRNFCGEEFTNTATARSPAGTLNEQDKESLYTPCPYLLTQGIGDVILEQDLNIGSDILSCAGIPNIEGPTLTPRVPPPPGIPRTGAGDIFNIPSHGLCRTGDPLKSVSSAVCELSLTIADLISKPRIRADVTENLIRATRGNTTLGKGNITIFDLNAPPIAALGVNPNPNYKIYKLADGNLTIDGQQILRNGAVTYVVENGDLIINGNISYDKNIGFDLAGLDKIPSIAFIVINGSVKIAPHITEISGVYVSLSGARKDSGKIIGTGNSDKPLAILGSMYGDIEPLFESRTYTGLARRGEGTISINYDGRLYYNMPPGLKEVLEIKEEQVAR